MTRTGSSPAADRTRRSLRPLLFVLCWSAAALRVAAATDTVEDGPIQLLPESESKRFVAEWREIDGRRDALLAAGAALDERDDELFEAGRLLAAEAARLERRKAELAAEIAGHNARVAPWLGEWRSLKKDGDAFKSAEFDAWELAISSYMQEVEWDMEENLLTSIRFHARGGRTEKSAELHRRGSISLAQAEKRLEAWWGELAPTERSLRTKARLELLAFLREVSAAGGAGPLTRAFHDNPACPDIRLEVEVERGQAFVSAPGDGRAGWEPGAPAYQKRLDRALPGWHILRRPEFHAAVLKRVREQPGFAVGDFNGDGAADFAALVRRSEKKRYGEPAEGAGAQSTQAYDYFDGQLVVCHGSAKDPEDYDCRSLSAMPVTLPYGSLLRRVPPGETHCRPADAGSKRVPIDRDAIVWEYPEKGGSLYSYGEDGAYRTCVSSD